jgi:hypothetical protein
VFHSLSRNSGVSSKCGFVDDHYTISSRLQETGISEEGLLIFVFKLKFNRKTPFRDRHVFLLLQELVQCQWH